MKIDRVERGGKITRRIYKVGIRGGRENVVYNEEKKIKERR